MHLETIETEKPAPFADAVEASAEVDASRVDVLREEVHVLEVPMTDEEQRAKGVELAEVHAVIAKLEADLEAKTAHHKAEKNSIQSEIDAQLAQAKFLAQGIRDKQTTKEVPVRVEAVFATSTIRVVRKDTNETIETRAMEAHERQRELFQSEAPESFSSLHEDESEPPQAITVRGEIISVNVDNDGDSYDFTIALASFGTHVRVTLHGKCNIAGLGFAVGYRVEMVGTYADNGDDADAPALFVATQIQVFDPATEIDATKMATVGDVVEAKKTNGKGRRK